MPNDRIHSKIKNKGAWTYIISLVVSVLATLFISLYVVGLAIVYGPSMQPTLKSGDVVVVNKMAQTYERFDVVIIKTSDETLIKRVIGLPGETIQITEGTIYVNDVALDDVIVGKTDFAGIACDVIRLNDGEYFVLGDNRSNSRDSRMEEIGVIQERQLVGTVIFSLMPPSFLK